MDPVSAVGVAGAAAQFAGLAVLLLKSLSRYCTDVKEAPIQAFQLRREIATMSDVVNDLQITLEIIPNGLAASQATSIHNTLTSSITLLTGLLEKVNRVSSAENQKNVFSRMMWPFKKQETDQYIGKIQEFKSTISLTLQIDQTLHPPFSLLIIGRHVSRQILGNIQELGLSMNQSQVQWGTSFV